jgi:hypothetical protein
MNSKNKNEREFAVTKKGKEFWCNPVWHTIHIFAATMRPGSSVAYKTFLTVCLPALLPCDVCCANLLKKFTAFPPDPYMGNNHDAFFYSYVLHDLVTEHINEEHPELPPKISPNFDDVKAYYFGSLSQECKDCST